MLNDSIPFTSLMSPFCNMILRAALIVSAIFAPALENPSFRAAIVGIFSLGSENFLGQCGRYEPGGEKDVLSLSSHF